MVKRNIPLTHDTRDEAHALVEAGIDLGGHFLQIDTGPRTLLQNAEYHAIIREASKKTGNSFEHMKRFFNYKLIGGKVEIISYMENGQVVEKGIAMTGHSREVKEEDFDGLLFSARELLADLVPRGNYG